MPKQDAERYGLEPTDWTHENIIAMKHVKANLGEYNQLTFFERSSTGVVLHKRDIVLSEFADDAVEDAQEERKDERKRARAQADMDAVLSIISTRNKNGETPTGRQIRTVALAELGIPDTRSRTAIDMLEMNKAIRRTEDPLSTDSRSVAGFEVVE